MTDNTWGRDDTDSSPDLSVHTHHIFKFHGSGKEFFGIWIVNILLTILTLGIYSAWAKVRTKRYFNGNTELAGHRFDYHADPKKILIGRIIVVAVLIVLGIIQQLHPAAGLAVLLFYAIALPWVIIRGLAFNANMTSYRNVRFHFKSTKWKAFFAYIFLPATLVILIVAIVTAAVTLIYATESPIMMLIGFIVAALVGIMFLPLISRANARFLGDGHSFGESNFSADPPLKPYLKGVALGALLVVIAMALVSFLNINSASKGLAGLQENGPIYTSSLIIYTTLILSGAIYSVYARNNNFAHLKLQQGHRFNSTVKVVPFTWIIVTNVILTLVTLTLYYPWAKVRLARYLAENTHMYAADDLNEFVDQQDASDGVASGEFLDIEGFDFGF